MPMTTNIAMGMTTMIIRTGIMIMAMSTIMITRTAITITTIMSTITPMLVNGVSTTRLR